MAITITTAEVKRKAMIPSSETGYDSSIGALIAEMQPALEYSIADIYLNDPSEKLQATLKLGMLEIMTGEFIEQLRREPGNAEEFSVAGVSIGAAAKCGVELIQQGAARLAPYFKAAAPAMSESAASSTTKDRDTIFSADEEDW